MQRRLLSCSNLSNFFMLCFFLLTCTQMISHLPVFFVPAAAAGVLVFLSCTFQYSVVCFCFGFLFFSFFFRSLQRAGGAAGPRGRSSGSTHPERRELLPFAEFLGFFLSSCANPKPPPHRPTLHPSTPPPLLPSTSLDP